ncbi:MAG: MFS transporter, partial [Phoenicibacter congonensis]|nr:MFS transporter [Phoenicibacter congonensis]
MGDLPERKGYSKVQKSTIFVAVLTSLLTTFIGSATNLSIPDMSEDFAVGAAAIGWVVTAYMLPVAAFSVPFGRIADMIGRKKILVAGIAVFIVGSFASALSFSFGFLIMTRVVQAMGSAMIFATNHAVLISEFPGKDRGRVLGYALAATYTGLSAGPVLGGIINHCLGWRYIFAVTGLVGIVVMIEAIRRLPERAVQNGENRFDRWGNFLYVAMILSIIYGLNAFSEKPLALVLVPLGILFGVLFIRRERNAVSPLVDVRLFATNLSYS